jgi:hypothetical protein
VATALTIKAAAAAVLILSAVVKDPETVEKASSFLDI